MYIFTNKIKSKKDLYFQEPQSCSPSHGTIIRLNLEKKVIFLFN